jgi:protein-ribulosamine 3-kinase
VLDAGIRRAIEAAAGTRVKEGGGPRLTLEDGRKLFVKIDRAAPTGMFSREVEGLEMLRATNALRVPDVVAFAENGDTPAFVAMELLEGAAPARLHDEDLGRGLALVHATKAERFGLSTSNFIAVLPQDNTEADAWPLFYRDRRLAPLVRRAIDRRILGASVRARFDSLFARIDELAATRERPALLHGDLWSGNAVTDERGAPCLIDPSVYFGHREIDLAMMRLFGGFGPRVFAAYEEAAPLEPDHRARVALYQLYPLLVHVGLFGASYVAQLESTLDRALAA